jgi:hypothetical protein
MFCKNENVKSECCLMIILLYLLIICTLLISCSKSTQPDLIGEIENKGKITMESSQVRVNIHFLVEVESDNFIIDWGDGNKELTKKYPRGNLFFKKYNEDIPHIITIYGDVIRLRVDNMELTKLDVTMCPTISSLECSNNYLSELDISNNLRLMYLYCYSNELSFLNVSNKLYLYDIDFKDNKLKNIDLRDNMFLQRIWCQDNDFDTSELNNIFSDLGFAKRFGTIYIHNNPGTSGCSMNIALEKGWIVDAETSFKTN